MLVGDALLLMHGGELRSVAVSDNGSLLVRLRPAAGPIAVLVAAGQRCVAGCRAAWPYVERKL